MESNALKKSMIHCVTLRFFCTYSFGDLIDSQNLWSYVLISPKTILIFPKNFIDFWFDTVEKQNIINLSHESYASIVLNNSQVAFLGKGEDAAFYLFISCVLFLDSVAKNKDVSHQIS